MPDHEAFSVRERTLSVMTFDWWCDFGSGVVKDFCGEAKTGQ